MKKNTTVSMPEETKAMTNWRIGFDQGIKQALSQHEIEIKIGKAIISALDSRYEKIEDEY